MTTSFEASTRSTGAPAAPRLFAWPDYLVFAISLAVPLLIGIYFFLKSYKQPSTDEFLTGKRSLNFIVVSLSLVASLLNGIFVIGQPAEIHYYGAAIFLQFIGLAVAVVVVSHVFVVKYQKMMFTSAYEYVERRYNVATRLLASAVFSASIVMFLVVVLYAPALAFSQVTNLSVYMTVIITGAICTIYTTIGGIKAVVWTDAIQMLILLGGLIAIATIGTIRVGGANHVWETAKRDGRVNFDKFSFDPRERTTFWTQAVGGTVSYIGIFISNQMMVQRFMSVSTPRQAQRSLYGILIITLPLFCLIVFIGFVLHAYYSKCDPLISGAISTGDKIVPLFLMELLGDYPGVPGLIMSSVFAAALSSVSSIINSLAAVGLEDFIDPAYTYFKGKKLTDRKRRWIAVVIVMFFGAVTIGLSFYAYTFAGKLVQGTSIAAGAFGGPLASVFIMGFLMPFVNSWGAISGMLSGMVVGMWVSVGALINGSPNPPLPLGACTGNTTFTITTPAPTHPLSDWYNISYGWYNVVGSATCMIVGIIVSLLTKGYSYAYRSSRDPAVMFSVADECCCCCPLSCRKCYRCGVKFEDEDEVILQNGDDTKIAHVNGTSSNNDLSSTKIPHANGVINTAYEPNSYKNHKSEKTQNGNCLVLWNYSTDSINTYL